jgi:glutaredoxin/glutathione-dependent peroxiredoxin
MTIEVGEKLPSSEVTIMDSDGPTSLNIAEFCQDKKVVMFAVPGAFTPTCSNSHLPGYVELKTQMKSKGVDAIICLSVNDVFVMNAWGKDQNAEGIIMAADGNAELTKALGLELDASGFGMGLRCQRFALIAKNGVVTHLNVEPPKTFEGSKAEAILALL